MPNRLAETVLDTQQQGHGTRKDYYDGSISPVASPLNKKKPTTCLYVAVQRMHGAPLQGRTLRFFCRSYSTVIVNLLSKTNGYRRPQYIFYTRRLMKSTAEFFSQIHSVLYI